MFFLNRKKEKNAPQLALEGEVLRIKGKYKEALKNFNKAIEMEPDNDMYYASRSRIKKELKDFASAKEDIEKAISLKQSVNLYKKIKESI